MSDGRLVFPVKFDLDQAVRNAEGEVERVMNRLNTAVRTRPLVLEIEISNKDHDGSIDNIRKEMAEIVKEWNNLSEAERIHNQQSGKYTDDAQKLLDRYMHLVAASESYAKSLTEIAAAARRAEAAEQRRVDKANADEEKRLKKLKEEQDRKVQKSRETVAMLKAEETSLAAVAAKRSHYQKIMESKDFGSKAYIYAAQQIERLGAQYQRLLEIMNTRTGNQGKDQFNFEKLVRSLGGAENTIDQVNAKLKALNQLLRMSEPNSAQWKAYADDHARLTGILQDMQSKQKEATKTEAQLREERERAARQEMENQRAIKAARAQTNAEVERERSARQTLIAQKRQEIATLNGEEKTLDQVNAKLRIRRELMNKADPNSAAYKRNAAEIIRLTELLDELARKQKEATKTPLSLAKVAGMPEKTIADLTAKIEAYRNIMNQSDFGSRKFTDAMMAAQSLTTKLEQMNKTVADFEKLRLFDEALKSSAKTMEGLNALISAWQSKMQGLEVGTPAWREAAQYIAQYSRELQRANQYAQDFQSKAMQGLAPRFADREVEKMRQLRAEIQNCDEVFNRLREAGKAVDSKGNLTPQAIKWLQDKATYTKMLAELTLDSDKALQKYQESERKAAEASKRRADALKKQRDVLAANEERIVGLTNKLNFYQSLIQKQQVGSAAWTKTALEIRRLSDELDRANQRLQDFQSKSFKGVTGWLVDEQVQKLQMLRAEIQSLDSRLHASRQSELSGRGSFLTPEDQRRLLDERIAKTKQINEILKSGADLQLERERQITAETEKRRRLLEDMRQKEKEHDAAKGERRALAIAEQRRKAAGLLTKEQEKRQRMLNAEENTVNAIQKKLAYYREKINGQVVDSNGFKKTAAEIDRLTKLLEAAQQKIDALTGKTTAGAGRQERAYNRVSEAMRKQSTYIERLVQRMAIYASFSAMGNFLSKVREVTAQFELQRISLGAIIQDQNRADQLFSEIKQFALKSPVSILDMTKYTKQVAAYRIETEKLFDTTKRLADVSVGLGVDMGRIVLAYGQVRAASYLRAAEIRQFTEAGIPMLELLSEKLTKLNGELVTTEQVMNLVSKRGVDFKMVEEIFNDMTSAGGMFYNMQERQGNTLHGMWAKLGDAASMMYDEIGNTDLANSGMKTLIESLTDLMRNWKAAGIAAGGMAVMLGALMLKNKALTTGIKQKELADQRAAAAVERKAEAQKRYTNLLHYGSAEEKAAAKATLDKATIDEKAALAAQKKAQAAKASSLGLSTFWKSFSSMVGWTLAITAISTLIYKISEAITEASRLKDKLNEIWSETAVLQSQSVRNFERLAQKAVSAVDGSKAQKDALDELSRTYKNILPDEALRIENLRAMKGNYDSLTQAVREYIAAQQEQKALNTINEEEGAVQTKMQKKLREVMIDKKLGPLALSEEEVQRFFRAFEKTALDTSKSVKEQFVNAFVMAGLDGAEEMWKKVKKINKDLFTISGGHFVDEETLVKQRAAIGALSQSLARQDTQLKAVSGSYSVLTQDLGKYTALMQEYTKYIADNEGAEDTFLQNQQNVNLRIKTMAGMIEQAFKGAGLEWKKQWADIIDTVNPKELGRLSSLNMQEIIAGLDPNDHPDLWKYIDAFRKIYYDLIPQDAAVQQIRTKLFQVSNSFGVSMDTMRRFLWDGSGAVDEHLKTLKEQIDSYKATLQELKAEEVNKGMLAGFFNIFNGNKIGETEKIIKALEEQVEFVKQYVLQSDKKTNSGQTHTYERDGRVQTLQEMERAISEMHKQYEAYEKRVGKSKAEEYLVKMYRQELDYLNDIGKEFGIKFDFPRTRRDLMDYQTMIYNAMSKIPTVVAKRGLITLGKEIDKDWFNALNKELDGKLKEISDQISRTKTAKEFFTRILNQTGDAELALHLSTAVYGDDGQSLEAQIRRQVEEIVRQTSASLPPSVFFPDGSLNPKMLRAFAQEQAEALGGIEGKAYQELIKLSENAEKDFAKTIEEWLKATEKAKTYSDKILDIRRRTQSELSRIESARAQGRISNGFASEQTKGYLRKEAEEVAKLEYEAFKDSPMYTQMFDDLDNASTRMLENMRRRLSALQGEWKNLDPASLKEMQSRLNEIDAQLAKRNPFKALGDAIRQYRELSKNGDARGNRSAREAAGDLIRQAAEAREAERIYRQILADDTATKEQIAVAKSRLDVAMSNEKAAQKAVEAWKKVKDMIGLSANELFAMMNWAGDIAKGVAEISEALGADEEDVQYWNTVADSLSQISAGIQDIVKSAMSGNVVGIISSTITAIPKMFVGISNLFYAARIKKANKEIKRQQELLDQLQYTYSRLEAMSEKVFGVDYVSNYKQREKALQAQADAYKKQADAERSKGKKADEAKIKEYEDAWRDTLDEIADMQGELSSRILGTDLASAARDFAQAWLEAYKEFAKTSDKMSEKFRDMVENMVVEGALARVMERALRPMFDMIDSMDESDFYNQSFWRRVVNQAKTGADAANAGALTMMKFLEQAGINVRDLGVELTGIQREYATASEESVAGLAAATNTQNFYMSQISGNVQIIRRLIEERSGSLLTGSSSGSSSASSSSSSGSGSSGSSSSSSSSAFTPADLFQLQRDSLSNLQMIERNTAQTVVACLRAAEACESHARSLLRLTDSAAGTPRLRVKL